MFRFSLNQIVVKVHNYFKSQFKPNQIKLDALDSSGSVYQFRIFSFLTYLVIIKIILPKLKGKNCKNINLLKFRSRKVFRIQNKLFKFT